MESLKHFVTKQNLNTKKEHNSDLPLISIVIPSFNQAEFLERTLLSLINQNYPNLEIILIDGGSTDNTLQVIKQYEPWLHYWESEKDSGQSEALNKGFAKATGEIFGWLNSDDLYCPDALLTAATLFGKNPDSQIVFGDYYEIDQNDTVINRIFAFDFNLNHFIYEGFHLNAQSMFWRRKVHERFGTFNIALHRTMDYDMIVRFGINEGEAAFLRTEKILGCFRRHELQKTRSTEDKGLSKPVIAEHMEIAKLNNFTDKYLFAGRIKHLVYRFRRAYWYVKRGGVRYMLKRMRGGQL